jgi:hypothetical protein
MTIKYPIPGDCNCDMKQPLFTKDGFVYCVKRVTNENVPCHHTRCLETQRCQKPRSPDEITDIQSFENWMIRFYPTKFVVDGVVHQANVLNCPGCRAEEVFNAFQNVENNHD